MRENAPAGPMFRYGKMWKPAGTGGTAAAAITQIIEATFSSPMMRASERTSLFWSSRNWNSSGIAADFNCWTSSASGSIGMPVALGLACRFA